MKADVLFREWIERDGPAFTWGAREGSSGSVPVHSSSLLFLDYACWSSHHSKPKARWLDGPCLRTSFHRGGYGPVFSSKYPLNVAACARSSSLGRAPLLKPRSDLLGFRLLGPQICYVDHCAAL